jgi:hypothetical protein
MLHQWSHKHDLCTNGKTRRQPYKLDGFFPICVDKFIKPVCHPVLVKAVAEYLGTAYLVVNAAHETGKRLRIIIPIPFEYSLTSHWAWESDRNLQTRA